MGDSPLWMGTEEYSKLAHDLRKEEKEAAAKAAEEAKVAASGVKEVVAGAGEGSSMLMPRPHSFARLESTTTSTIWSSCRRRPSHTQPSLAKPSTFIITSTLAR